MEKLPSWSSLIVYILFIYNSKYCHFVSSECIDTFLPNLLPAEVPPEIKEFIFRQKTSEVFDFMNLLVKFIISSNEINHIWKKASHVKFHCLVKYYTRLHLKIKSLINALHRPLKVEFMPAKNNILNALQEKISVGLGKVVTLQTDRKYVKFRQEKMAIEFQFTMPFDQHLNITFIPVERKDTCPFIFCFCIHKVALQYLDKTCTIVKGTFPPWSVLLKHETYFGKTYINFRLYLTLLYTEYDSCSKNLFQMNFQPTISRTQSHAYESVKVNKAKYRGKKCCISNSFYQLESNKNPKYVRVKTIRIAVHPNQYLTVKSDLDAYVKHCESENAPLYIHDGPGVLSYKMKKYSTRNNVLYKALTYQVFVLKIVEQHRNTDKCILRYEGIFWFGKESVKVNDSILSYHFQSQSASRIPHCIERRHITFCRLKFEAEQTLLLNVTALRGNTCVSYSEYQNSYSDQTKTIQGIFCSVYAFLKTKT